MLVKLPNIKCHGNSFSSPQVATHGQTDIVKANQHIFVTFSCKHMKIYGLIKCTECDTLSIWSQPRMLRNRYVTDKDLFCCVFCNVMLSETILITRMGSTIFHICISYTNMKYSETIQITRMGSTTGTILRPGHE
jgi:hypothetical protein